MAWWLFWLSYVLFNLDEWLIDLAERVELVLELIAGFMENKDKILNKRN